MQILVVHETQQLGMVTVVIPNEMRETRDGLDRRHAVQFERSFGFIERAERVLQYRGE